MNWRGDYDTADWSLSDVQLAKKLHVSKQAVAAARRVRGIAPSAGHGGERKGAGRKREKRRKRKGQNDQLSRRP